MCFVVVHRKDALFSDYFTSGILKVECFRSSSRDDGDALGMFERTVLEEPFFYVHGLSENVASKPFTSV